MTAFLCLMAFLVLIGVGQFEVKGTVPVWLFIVLRMVQVLFCLGLCGLALWSHLS